jgi:hypothetical protein
MTYALQQAAIGYWHRRHRSLKGAQCLAIFSFTVCLQTRPLNHWRHMVSSLARVGVIQTWADTHVHQLNYMFYDLIMPQAGTLPQSVLVPFAITRA